MNKIRINKDLLLCSILSFSIISYHGGIYSIYKRERADKIKDHSVRSEMLAINSHPRYDVNVHSRHGLRGQECITLLHTSDMERAYYLAFSIKRLEQEYEKVSEYLGIDPHDKLALYKSCLVSRNLNYLRMEYAEMQIQSAKKVIPVLDDFIKQYEDEYQISESDVDNGPWDNIILSEY